MNRLVASVRFTGKIGIVGVFVPQDPGASDELAKQGKLAFDYGMFWFKGQHIGSGQAPVKKYNRQLRDLIAAGKAEPSFIVSHELPLDQAPEAYEHFDNRDDGWTKVVLHPAMRQERDMASDTERTAGRHPRGRRRGAGRAGAAAAGAGGRRRPHRRRLHHQRRDPGAQPRPRGRRHLRASTSWSAAVSVDDYEALLLPGGTVNPDKLRMEPAAVQFVRDFVQSGKPVASICHGPWNFVEADVARGRRLTSWPSVRTDLRNAGAEVVDEQVVTDGNITTSRSPDDLPAFCERIVQEFARAPQPPARGSGMTSALGNVASLAARAGGSGRPAGALGHRPVGGTAGRRGPRRRPGGSR